MHHAYQNGPEFINYAGPFVGKMFLIIVDGNSRWLEVRVVETTISAGTIQKLWQCVKPYMHFAWADQRGKQGYN